MRVYEHLITGLEGVHADLERAHNMLLKSGDENHSAMLQLAHADGLICGLLEYLRQNDERPA